MRRLLLGIVLALGLVYVAPATTATSATATVQITKTGFVPARVTINAGDSVTWKNADKVNHQVVANGGQFASPILAPGKSYTHTFNGGGTFRYHDALHTSLRGTVVVKGPPPQVTLAASAGSVKYGTPVTLTGTVSNKKAGETVTLVQLPYGQTTKQVIATLQTTTGGAFSFSVTPQIYTQYQAQWKNLSESSVFVQVAPMIKLPTPSRSGYFHFYVQAGTSFAGRYAFLQRFTLYHQWINIARLKLGARSGRLITVGSVARLLPRGRWSIRVFFPADQAGGGFVDAASGTQPVVRRR
jgi:plastocyanin